MQRFIDLFSGIGGFRLALEKEGMQCVFSSEIDKHARDVYHRNFGDIPSGDIQEIDVREIPSHDILCGGFPCQPFSICGKMGGLQDDRGMLFYDIIRIVKHHKPHILLLENVKNMLSIDNGSVIMSIKSKLHDAGYEVKYNVLNSSLFGVPQKRERLYFVCIRQDSNVRFRYQPPEATNKAIYLKDIMESNVSPSLSIDTKHEINWIKPPPRVPSLSPIRLGTIKNGGQGDRIYSCEGHAITISASTGGTGARTGLYLDTEKRIRRLTQNECKAVMGFPKEHQVSQGLAGYSQLGNAVIPAMVRSVYASIEVV